MRYLTRKVEEQELEDRPDLIDVSLGTDRNFQPAEHISDTPNPKVHHLLNRSDKFLSARQNINAGMFV